MIRGFGRIAVLAAVLAFVPAAEGRASTAAAVRQDTAFSAPKVDAVSVKDTTVSIKNVAIIERMAIDSLSVTVAVRPVAFKSESRDSVSVASIDSAKRASRVVLPPSDSHPDVNPAALSIGLRLRTVAWAVRHPVYAYCWLRYSRPYSAVFENTSAG